MANFWYKFARMVYPLKGFFTKFGVGEGVLGPHHDTEFHSCGFKNVGLLPAKSPKMVP